jgi:L,D-transpeptidase catalytic domain
MHRKYSGTGHMVNIRSQIFSTANVIHWLRLPVMAALILSAQLSALPSVHTYAEIDAPLYYGEFFWDESGAPRARPEIVVDLRAEQIYVYRGGVEIGRAVITRGWGNYKTPLGTFPILEKDADHYSSTYGGAPMPYNLRLTWAGIAIHGADVDNIAATHGCIGIPLEFARTLFRNTRVGDKVFVTNNWKPEIYGYP